MDSKDLYYRLLPVQEALHITEVAQSNAYQLYNRDLDLHLAAAIYSLQQAYQVSQQIQANKDQEESGG